MNDDQAKALAFVADQFPNWQNLSRKVKTIGELLTRKTSELLEKYRGWHTFADGLREHLGDLAPRQIDQVVKWIDAQPLGALVGS